MSTQKQIDHYIYLLKQYNESTNIYSKKAYDKLDFHIQDSQQLASLIGNESIDVLDMGSGSGLPSLIIAIMNPNNCVTAIESKSRKSKFLAQAAEKLELHNYSVQQIDIHEYIARERPQPQVVTAKAFMPYDKVIDLTQKFAYSGLKLFIPISNMQQQALSLIPKPHFEVLDIAGFCYVSKCF